MSGYVTLGPNNMFFKGSARLNFANSLPKYCSTVFALCNYMTSTVEKGIYVGFLKKNLIESVFLCVLRIVETKISVIYL